MKKIRILLADDHNLIRRGLRLVIEQQPDLAVVGEASDGREAVSLAASLKPEVAVLDIGMPNLNGIEAAKRMIEAKPSTRVVFLTVEKDRDTCHAALEVGVRGYVLKPRLATDLIRAITLANDGGCFVSPGCE